MTILLLESIHREAEAMLSQFEETILATDERSAEEAAQTHAVRAIVTRGRGRVTNALMEYCRDLQVVARCGVGLDNIDLAAANIRGIPVVYAPGSTTHAVAEHTLMLILAASRHLRQIVGFAHNGHWNAREGYTALELRGRTLGILGLGAIGTRVAELAEVFGMQVIAWSRTQREGRIPFLGLEEVLRTADVISIHVSLTPATRYLIGARELALMKPSALLINTARGAVIDQRALADALGAGTLGYFAADVLDPEPPGVNERLLQSERVLITPHTAALTDTTFRAMCLSTAANVLRLLRGEAPEAHAVYRM